MELGNRVVRTFIHVAATAVVAIGLTACAAKHIIPAADYANASTISALRVALDQDGNIYPRKEDPVFWVDYPQPFKEKLLGNGFQLATLQANTIPTYTDSVKLAASEDIINQMNARLASKKMLIVLVHGFNNNFREAASNFERMNSSIDPVVRDNAAILEVYWDGLNPRGDGVVWQITAFSFWRKALLNSDLAGTRGLRTLLNGIDKDVDVRFVTHSRGAGVVMSALADPEFRLRLGITKVPPLRNPHIKSIKIAAFAPAIGSGHLVDTLDAQLASHPVEFVAGFNQKDFATSKFGLIPAYVYGQTNLGSDVDFIGLERKKCRSNFKLRAFEFTHGAKHSFVDYIEDKDLTRCMFSVIDLASFPTTGCDRDYRAN